jgi:hypothetical protein
MPAASSTLERDPELIDAKVPVLGCYWADKGDSLEGTASFYLFGDFINQHL